ncbi:class I SAM-dependent methyltransferase [Patescibacteria group bacterium]|nr:class I SAM-dependent methyltransferase [Patescibacteria group bacterium]
MKKIDWYKHYLTKQGLLINPTTLKENWKHDRAFLKILKKFVKPPAKILETGCGLARTCLSMALTGYKVTAIDIDDRILTLAKLNTKPFTEKIIFKKADFWKLKIYFKKDSFDCITHGGVLEHFSIKEIQSILNKQLHIAPYIIFSVPIKSRWNTKYFDDTIFRNLWLPKFWLVKILKNYNIRYHKVIKDRKDSLVVVLSRPNNNS